MIKAHTLFVVLVISLIISLICGGLIMHVFLQKSYLLAGQREVREIQNINSGLQILLASNEVEQQSEYVSDSTILNKEYWGFYELISVANGQSTEALHKAGLLGYKADRKQGLYLQDRNQELTLVGKTIISGNTFLPKAGVKRGYQSGNPFQGVNGHLVNGNISNSSTQLPKCNKELIQPNLDNLKYKHLIDVDYRSDYSDSINIPFFETPQIIHRNTELVLQHTSLFGKVVVSSNVGVIVKRNCYLENTLIYAPYVIFENNFVGSTQVFATDSVLVGSDCEFQYPSTIALITESNFKNQRIELGENTTLDGAVVVYRELESKESPYLITKPDTKIIGQVYVNGIMEHHGVIHGQVWASKFKEQTITDVTIDPTQLDPNFAVSAIMGKENKRIIATWLE